MGTVAANEVPVSTERILEELKKYAVPGFTGRVRIPVRVMPEAALDVEFGPAEVLESQPVGTAKVPFDVRVFDPPGHRLPTERELLVRQKLAENAHKFKLGMRVTAVIGHFDKNGNLNRFDLEMVG